MNWIKRLICKLFLHWVTDEEYWEWYYEVEEHEATNA